jgi:hypothetical protein
MAKSRRRRLGGWSGLLLFYSKWLAGRGKHEALREAQLEMRDRVKARYGIDRPTYWGGFVLVGRWTPAVPVLSLCSRLKTC